MRPQESRACLPTMLPLAYSHAYDYAMVGGDHERAFAYADWYDREFIGHAETMKDLPAHSHAYRKYLDWLSEVTT